MHIYIVLIIIILIIFAIITIIIITIIIVVFVVTLILIEVPTVIFLVILQQPRCCCRDCYRYYSDICCKYCIYTIYFICFNYSRAKACVGFLLSVVFYPTLNKSYLILSYLISWSQCYYKKIKCPE